MTTTVGAPPGVFASGYRAVPWSPASIPGVMGWWDASDTASITAAAGSVSQWNDKSGNARHLNTTGATKPKTGTRSINGLNALDFVPACYISGPFPAQAQPVTVLLVAQADTINAAGNNYLINAGAVTYVHLAKWGMYAGGGELIGPTTANTTNPHVYCAQFDYTSSKAWLDGAAEITTGNPGAWGPNGNPIVIGQADTGSSWSWDGLIAEIAIYNRALTTPERQQVETYLKTKWGTP